MSETVVTLHLPVALAPVQGTLALALTPRREPPPAPVAMLDPDPSRAVQGWARRFVQAALEIVGGDRPASQLVRWTDRDVYADLERRAWLVARAGGHVPGTAVVQAVRPRVRSVHACVLDARTVEAAVHVAQGGRSRAVATRFELRRGRWVCTALDFVPEP